MKPIKIRRRSLIYAILLFTLFWLGKPAPLSNAAPQGVNPLQQPDHPAEIIVRIYYRDSAELASLVQTLDVWEAHPEQGYLIARISVIDQAVLASAGLRVEVDPEKTALISQPHPSLPYQTNGIPGFPCYRTVEETYADLSALAAEYPDLARWVDIGDSWEKVQSQNQNGYDIYALVLTNRAIPGPKPTFFLMAAIHAREYTTAEMATRFAETLVEQYGKDPDITWLLNDFEVHIVPVSNPDGRKIAELGQFWRKNTDNDDGCLDSSAWGTDLNRNSSFKWGGIGSSPSACDETYHGPAQNSEPETQALQNYLQSIFPDQRGPLNTDPAPLTSTGALITLHSYGELDLWPWGWSTIPAPNNSQLQTLGRKFAFFNGYSAMQSIGLYPTTGSTDDWAYGELGVAAYTFEMGTAFFQSCSDFENTIFPDNLKSLTYAFKAARRPYQNPAGPDSLNIQLSSPAVISGETISVTVTADDTRYLPDSGEPFQAIGSAHLSVDLPPWDPLAELYTFSPVDGAFDSPVETLTAAFDTLEITAGRHLIYVESQDTNGNWGVASAIFFYVVDPPITPSIEGHVRDGGDNHPISAGVSAGDFQSQSDASTGLYHLDILSGTYDLRADAAGYSPATTFGVSAEDHQHLDENIFLYPVCQIFKDDAENGNTLWAPQAPWAITTETSYSGSHSWTDSPGSNYHNNVDASLISKPLDLSGYEGIKLSFWHKYALEQPLFYDVASVEYSLDGGSTWTILKTYTGISAANWSNQVFTIPALDNQANVRLRFRLNTDDSVTADGWHLDDITLVGSGSACITPIAPQADFSSKSPVPSGEPVQFTNRTLGSNPLEYLWDFGDSVGSSTVSDPRVTFPTTGTFTVTLTVTNSLGTSSASHLLEIGPPLPYIAVQSAELELESPPHPNARERVTLSAVIGPPDATVPFTYTIDYGDQSPLLLKNSPNDEILFAHHFNISGTFTITFSAYNQAGMIPVTTTLPLSVGAGTTPGGISVVNLSLANPGGIFSGKETSFSADLEPDNATQPYTYTVDFGDSSPELSASGLVEPFTFKHVYATTGVFTLTLDIINPVMTIPVTGDLSFTVNPPVSAGPTIYLPLIWKREMPF